MAYKIAQPKSIAQPKCLVITGYGINCDEETKYAFELAGAKADIVHINDVIANSKMMDDYQILSFPGGFSYGDDTGSGNALANRIRNHLEDEIKSFVEKDKLAIGICNGFQVMVNLGLLPAVDGEYLTQQAALEHNDSARYLDRWVDLQFKGSSPWTKNLGTISMPIAHGEGKFYADSDMLDAIHNKGLVAATYTRGEICQYLDFQANPNGSVDNIAGITDESGRLIGMMPHPERAIDYKHRPDWPYMKELLKRHGLGLPKEGEGLKIFRNGVEYFG